MVSKRSRIRKHETGSERRRDYVFEAIEPRILLSADPLGAAVGDAASWEGRTR